MKHCLYILLVGWILMGVGQAAEVLEIGGVYEVPRGSVDFANGWGNATGVKVRVATRGSATDNLGLSFCYCQYPAVNALFDMKMMSFGLSQKSTFQDAARVRPYIKGEAGVMQALDVWESSVDPVTGATLRSRVRSGHTDWYLSAHTGLTVDVFQNYEVFVETGFILTLEGARKKVVPFQIGIAFHP